MNGGEQVLGVGYKISCDYMDDGQTHTHAQPTDRLRYPDETKRNELRTNSSRELYRDWTSTE